MRVIKKIALCLGFAGSLLACMPTGFLASKNSGRKNDTQSVALDPKTQSNDRPTETGAGVPGYLVNCSDINATTEGVQVGCSVSTLDGKRVPASEDTWTRYDVQLAPNFNPNISVTKSIASSDANWDVFFLFKGAPLPELRTAALASTYSYTYTNDKGETVKAETAPSVTKTTQTGQNCNGGVVVEGVCIVTVATSCTEYCGQSQRKVHPWVVERFGTGAEGNRQACEQLYQKFPDLSPIILIGVTDIITGRGVGCHRHSSGLVFFDATPTDPSATPYIGYTRICACE